MRIFRRVPPAPGPAVLAPEDGDVLSAQARRLHALGSAMSDESDRNGLIGRAEAERLADRCGAAVSELVEAGLWDETDVSYVILALAV